MRSVCLLLALAFAHVSSEGTDDATHVVDLNPTNFDSLTKSGVWFIKFYAPWCGHCKRLAPILEEVAADLEGKANIGHVDCDQHTALCRQFDVSGYPTLYLVHGDLKRQYRGDRERRALADYITAMSRDPVQQTTLSELLATIRARIVFTIVGVPSAPAWYESVAQNFQGETFFYFVSNIPTVEGAPALNAGDVLVVRDGTPFVFTPTDSAAQNKERFQGFVQNNMFPLLPEVTRSSFRTLADARPRLLVAAIDAKTSNAQTLKDMFRDLSKASAGDVTFSWLDSNSWAKFLEHFGLSSGDLPAVLILENGGEDGHYVRKNIPDKQTVVDFLAAVKQGTEPNVGSSIFKTVQKVFESMAISLAHFIADYPILFGICAFLLFAGMVYLVLSDPGAPKFTPPTEQQQQQQQQQAQQPSEPKEESAKKDD